MEILQRIVLPFLLISQKVQSFTAPRPTQYLSKRTSLHLAKDQVEKSTANSVDIVLFGIGDLRTTDHEGLAAAMSKSGKVFPLVILDIEETLPNIPMGRTHTLDTAALLSAGIESLQDRLSKLNMHLHVKSGKNTVAGLMKDVLKEIKMEVPNVDHVTIHACDLGEVDNNLGYSPLSYLNDMGNGMDIALKSWNCHLRQNAWEDVANNPSSFPDTFVDFEKKYKLETGPGKTKQLTPSDTAIAMKVESIASIPSLDEINKLVSIALDYDLEDDAVKQKLEQSRNTGLFATHWGGLDMADTFHEDSVLKATDIFLGQESVQEEGDEALVDELKWWSRNSSTSKLARNELSLEHSAMNWMMTGDSVNNDDVKTENLIEGELLTRYMAAPILFGLVSPRFMWQKANEAANAKETGVFDSILPSLLKSRKTVEVVQTLVDAREWHTLFAAKKIAEDADQGDDVISAAYWRWHGFLCRYVSSNLNQSDRANANEKEGIALIHGFGASGSQWKKAIGKLQEDVNGNVNVEALAPDLIGFGQSEKPSLTYTQYLWESYSAAFIKEIALGKQKWDSFTVGGNSIGGYTAMSAAADDTVVNSNDNDESYVTASGANGSTKCKGLVLMNSAGKVFKKEEIQRMEPDPNGATVAEATANDLLGISSPPPRQIASIGGTGLLWYLRPRIQSICKNLYPTNPSAVDDILTAGILRDSLDPGAINVMISGSKLPPPRTANELLGADFGSSKNRVSKPTFDSKLKEGSFDGPVLVAQGFLDPLNDAKGRAAMFGDLRDGIKVDPINAGHCPHDELEEDISISIAKWLENDVRPLAASS